MGVAGIAIAGVVPGRIGVARDDAVVVAVGRAPEAAGPDATATLRRPVAIHPGVVRSGARRRILLRVYGSAVVVGGIATAHAHSNADRNARLREYRPTR